MTRNRNPYSAQVVLKLFIAGQPFVLSQVGPDFVVLRESPVRSIDPGIMGRIDVIVDNRISSSDEFVFPHGITAGCKRASYF